MTDDDIWDDLFHACALWAYLQQAAIEQGPPGSEATRQRAYRLYEEALAEKNRTTEGDACRAAPSPRREAGQGCAAPEGAAVVSFCL